MGGALAIRHGRVLTEEKFLEIDLVIRSGVIAGWESARADSVIDADGLLVSTGLIDIQINGGFGHDFTADPGSIWEVGEQLPATGVTSFLPTIISSPETQRSRALEVMAAGPPADYRGAHVLGLHFEGPMLAVDRRGTHPAEHLCPPSLDLIDGWERERGVRLVTLAPELDGAEPVIRALLDRGVVVAAGHSEATFEEARAALEAGVTHGTHLFNAMAPMTPRRPGLAGALLADRDMSVAIIVDGVHLHPATVGLVRRAKPARRVVLITDAMAGMGAGPGEYPLHDLVITVDETTARNADGGLAGSVLTLDRAVQNFAAFTGCSPRRALVAATAAPAQVIGESGRRSIGLGSPADLVLFDTGFNLQATILGGEIVHESDGFADRISGGRR